MRSRTVSLLEHQYVERDSGRVLTERPFADWIVNYFYCDQREKKIDLNQEVAHIE